MAETGIVMFLECLQAGSCTPIWAPGTSRLLRAHICTPRDFQVPREHKMNTAQELREPDSTTSIIMVHNLCFRDVQSSAHALLHARRHRTRLKTQIVSTASTARLLRTPSTTTRPLGIFRHPLDFQAMHTLQILPYHSTKHEFYNEDTHVAFHPL